MGGEKLLKDPRTKCLICERWLCKSCLGENKLNLQICSGEYKHKNVKDNCNFFCPVCQKTQGQACTGTSSTSGPNTILTFDIECRDCAGRKYTGYWWGMRPKCQKCHATGKWK